ncbi:Reverse transcriptase protein, partial [Thalictrum thalictroides]
MQLSGLPPLLGKDPSDIEKRAEELVQILLRSFAGSAKKSLPHNRGQPWWDQSCREAKRRFKRICASQIPTNEDKKSYRKVLRKAKALFYQKKLDEISNAKEAFKMSKWHKSKGQFRMPPLTDPLLPSNPPAHTPEAKRDVLLRNLLTNQSGTEDIPFSSPTVPRNNLPFPQLTHLEVSNAILGAGNTAPGKDGIPTSLLKLAWKHIENLVTELFQICIESGYHPQCFRTAILAIIEKPKKIDRTSPRSYRPIALLSVLGKGLERVVAKRMAWLTINHRVIARQQFGALPLRSSVDLTTCLTHD